MEFYFWPTSQNLNLMIDLDAHWINKLTHQLSQRFNLFWPPLIPTLAKPHDEVSLLTKFPELKFDHIFGCPFDIQACTPNFAMLRAIWTLFKPNSSENARRSFTFDNWNLIIDLDAHLIDKCAHQLSQCTELFLTPLSLTLVKLDVGVSLLSNFLELKFDHRFGCPFDIQVCMQNLLTFQNIFTPFNPNLSKTAWRSFTFDQFLGIKIWS